MFMATSDLQGMADLYATFVDVNTQPSRERMIPSRPTVQAIPVELFWEICEVLLEEKQVKTLESCTLVSKMWRSVAQSVLLSSVRIRTTRSFRRFIAFVHAEPEIARHIRTIKLAPRKRDLPLGGPDDDADSDYPFKWTSLNSRPHCPNSPAWLGFSWTMLAQLKIGNVCTEPRNAPAVIPAIAEMLSLSSVDVLTIKILRVDHRTDVQEHVETPHLSETGGGATLARTTHQSPPFTLKVSVLALASHGWDCATPTHLDFYRSMIPRSTLTSLTLQCESWRRIESLYALICAHRESLAHLNVDVTLLICDEYWEIYDLDRQEPPPELVVGRWRHLGEALFSCSRLEELELGIPYYSPDEDDILDSEIPLACLTVFADVFSASIPSTLATVTVHLMGIYHSDPGFNIRLDHIHLWDLSTLDQVLLDRVRLPNFRDLAIALHVPPWYLTRLPKLPSDISTLFTHIAETMLPRLHEADRIVWWDTLEGLRRLGRKGAASG
ncbi:hypothetical protein C8T65DRAFT_693608 [Cerioporus squamosus]|nr:hypothetical protein C8T65DRAFT_693608 [Cerioporus squamosus]